MKEQLQRWILAEMIRKAKLPNLPMGLTYSDPEGLEMKMGSLICDIIDKHGIINFQKSLKMYGHDFKVKQIGDFYRYWRKDVLGFDQRTSTTELLKSV